MRSVDVICLTQHQSLVQNLFVLFGIYSMEGLKFCWPMFLVHHDWIVSGIKTVAVAYFFQRRWVRGRRSVILERLCIPRQ